ncbi:mannose-1-phosphate guanylyltransferase/mannose-6-phosphate isomerase [Magnetofaba australis]|uniref:mannose-1-phosphate guanylyltransferase n=1 Tax=Magnetofaba australis IT-1 TaxID=1434232 RepID=A0A1Y2K2E9_9PROT|nr:mannose-1-phosphate guanylyltransferase/mannose-6-phosphate isomerase [Magnetofaba australis]OSM02129.1 putative mannose-1-phosphate guanylyltransferase/mannose-6-phosphate isomerase [Magnetofaba australis IT-1]
MIIPTLLSGGSGSRLWPLSREIHPKQFLPLLDGKSLFIETLERLSGLPDLGAPLVVCNDQHRFLAAEKLRHAGIESAGILLEPVGRNTAPAVACAALKALQIDPQAQLLVMPADHLIPDVTALHNALLAAREHSAGGALVTFGAQPEWAETGYGYIHRGAALPGSGPACYAIDRFVEKPDAETAQAYLQSGAYLWNSGMFLFRAERYLEELSQHAPLMVEQCQLALEKARLDLDFIRLDPESFEACPADSIDYAVMERTARGVVTTLDAGWSDIGSWEALWRAQQRDAQGNVTHGDVVLEDARDCLVRADEGLVTLLGVEGLVVVETADAVLVADKSRSQDVKKLVERLKRDNRREAVFHPKIYRPWGAFETISVHSRFQVKRITVNPGAKLSMQMHHHRAEHWVVVTGAAKVTRDGESFLLTEDQSTYIPVGVKHRLENPGKIPLQVIEVQSGSYLQEDDIVRFEDIYGCRKNDL